MINRSAPSTTIVPVVIYEDVAQAIEWLCGAFGFRERLRAPGPGGKISHAQVSFADGAMFLGLQGGPYRAPQRDGVSQYVMVHVDDVDRHYERAKQFGARIVSAPADRPFGERQYSVEDIGGHLWTFSQSIADVAPDQWGAIVAG